MSLSLEDEVVLTVHNPILDTSETQVRSKEQPQKRTAQDVEPDQTAVSPEQEQEEQTDKKYPPPKPNIREMSEDYFPQPPDLAEGEEDLFNKQTSSFRCLEQIFVSRSSLLRHPLYHFPPLKDPGLDKAFNFVGMFNNYYEFPVLTLNYSAKTQKRNFFLLVYISYHKLID